MGWRSGRVSAMAMAMAMVGVIAAMPVAQAASALVDRLDLGDRASEQAHALQATQSAVATGGLGQSARLLEPTATPSWKGGALDFDIRINPAERNYLTIRLWGGEASDNHLILSCDGKEIGYRLLGDYEALDLGSTMPAFPGSFYYRTTPLPLSLTKGRRNLHCQIYATGPLFNYGQAFETFQKPMTVPSRGLYDLFIHTGADLPRSAGLDDGTIAPGKPHPGPGLALRGAMETQTLAKVRARIEATALKLLASDKPLGQHELNFLSRVREKNWTKIAADPRIVPTLIKGMDSFAAAYFADPKIVAFEKTTWNPDWFGFGLVGEILARHPDWFADRLDQAIPSTSSAQTSRRAAYSAMLVAARNWMRQHRRFYTNQSMIVDLYGIYLANRGIAAITPDKAMPEQQALRYLYEATGIEEWRGDDLPGGGHSYDAGGPDGTKTNPYVVAKGYHLVTRQGLTRELGYVGGYGEVLDWVAAIYDGTRPAPDKPGDPKILAQLAKLARARAPFRYPGLDKDGYATMRLTTEIGWRDSKAPGDTTYVQRMSPGGGSAFQAAVLTRDPVLIGEAQQMLEDNQFFALVDMVMTNGSFRMTAGFIDMLDDVAAIAGLPRQNSQLPMSRNAPDFAFADPEDGVVAVKRGEEIFYASLYWRANQGINNLGRAFVTGPNGSRIATVEVETRFTPSGQVARRPASINPLRPEALNSQYGPIISAVAGEALPMAKAPDGVKVTPGTDSIYPGRGDFYVMRYADYTVAINMSESKSAAFDIPVGMGKDLLTGKTIAVGKTVMQPLSALIFHSNK